MPILKETKERMDHSLEAVRREFAAVRTGKATPALLDTVRVDAWGSKLPLNQVATVSTPEPSLLVVQPFDKSLIGEIEKGILVADLGLNQANDGALIRIPIPPLNEERRKEYVKLLHKLAEEGRVSVRVARHKANDDVKARVKEHELGEDEGRRQLNEIQRLTDESIGRIEDMLQKKEKEVMEL